MGDIASPCRIYVRAWAVAVALSLVLPVCGGAAAPRGCCSVAAERRNPESEATRAGGHEGGMLCI